MSRVTHSRPFVFFGTDSFMVDAITSDKKSQFVNFKVVNLSEDGVKREVSDEKQVVYSV